MSASALSLAVSYRNYQRPNFLESDGKHVSIVKDFSNMLFFKFDLKLFENRKSRTELCGLVEIGLLVRKG